MTITLGKLESRITSSAVAADWSFDITEVGGGAATDTITIPASSSYFHSSVGDDALDLADRIDERIGASVLNGTYATKHGAAENGTPVYTITCTPGVSGVTSFDIDNWGTPLRDLLGWTGNVTGALTYTAPNAMQGLWLPDGPPKTLAGLDDPMEESDETVTAPPGSNRFTNRINYGRRSYFEDLVYQGISRARARVVGEVLTNESLQRYWQDAIQGDLSYLSPESRLYPDADTDTTYWEVWFMGWPRMELQTMRDGYIQVWLISFPKMLVG